MSAPAYRSHPGQDSSVLRNAPVAPQAHKLGRPSIVSAVPGLGPESAAATVHAPPAAVPEQAAPQPTTEEVFKLAYEQGFDAGRRAAFDAELERELARAREEGMRQGVQAGMQAAQQEAAAAVQQAITALERIVAAIPAALQRRVAALEDDMLALCFETVTRLLGREAAAPEGLRALLRQALSELGPRQLVEIGLHPGDLKTLGQDEVAAQWLRQRAGGDGVQFVADPTIELGGVVLRSPAGRLDARLELQMQALRGALTAVRAGRAAAGVPSEGAVPLAEPGPALGDAR